MRKKLVLLIVFMCTTMSIPTFGFWGENCKSLSPLMTQYFCYRYIKFVDQKYHVYLDLADVSSLVIDEDGKAVGSSSPGTWVVILKNGQKIENLRESLVWSKYRAYIDFLRDHPELLSR